MAPTEGKVARPERLWGCRRGTPTGYQSKPHDGKWTHAPEEPEGRDRTGLTLYLEI